MRRVYSTERSNGLEQETFLPKSLIGKEATYVRNPWAALNRYIKEGDLAIDNNFVERVIGPITIDHINWLLAGSEAAGHRAAILTSLIASCKNNFVEPWAYLKNVLGAATKQLRDSSFCRSGIRQNSLRRLFRDNPSAKLPHKPQLDELTELLPDRWLTQPPEKMGNRGNMKSQTTNENVTLRALTLVRVVELELQKRNLCDTKLFKNSFSAAC